MLFSSRSLDRPNIIFQLMKGEFLGLLGLLLTVFGRVQIIPFFAVSTNICISAISISFLGCIIGLNIGILLLGLLLFLVVYRLVDCFPENIIITDIHYLSDVTHLHLLIVSNLILKL